MSVSWLLITSFLKKRSQIKKYIKDISLNSSRECEFVYKGENPNETLKKPL